jgi:hypothetical protein
MIIKLPRGDKWLLKTEINLNRIFRSHGEANIELKLSGEAYNDKLPLLSCGYKRLICHQKL